MVDGRKEETILKGEMESDETEEVTGMVSIHILSSVFLLPCLYTFFCLICTAHSFLLPASLKLQSPIGHFSGVVSSLASQI
jgi:hypothetical protein